MGSHLWSVENHSWICIYFVLFSAQSLEDPISFFSVVNLGDNQIMNYCLHVYEFMWFCNPFVYNKLNWAFIPDFMLFFMVYSLTGGIGRNLKPWGDLYSMVKFERLPKKSFQTFWGYHSNSLTLIFYFLKQQDMWLACYRFMFLILPVLGVRTIP